MLHEAGRREDLHLASLDVGLVDDAARPAEVVDMAVAVDHRDDRLLRSVLEIQVEGGAGGFRGGQGIDEHQAGVAFDDGHVRRVEAAHLVELRHDLEQAGDVVQLGLAPQAGVDRVGGVLVVEELVRAHVPHHLALGVLDLPAERRDQPAFGGLELLAVGERQALQHFGVLCGGDGAGRFAVQALCSQQRLGEGGGDQGGEQRAALAGANEAGHGDSCRLFLWVGIDRPA
ncbi:hypothetical protein D9M71_550360 [compost metagenome]